MRYCKNCGQMVQPQKNKTDVLKSIEELNGDNQETETEDKSLKEQYRKKQIKTMKECIEDAEQVANETYAEEWRVVLGGKNMLEWVLEDNRVDSDD